MLNTIGKLHQHILNEEMKKRKKGQFDTTQCSVMQGDAMHYHSINIILYKRTWWDLKAGFISPCGYMKIQGNCRLMVTLPSN